MKDILLIAVLVILCIGGVIAFRMSILYWLYNNTYKAAKIAGATEEEAIEYAQNFIKGYARKK